MNVTRVWLALLASIGVLFAYEAVLALAQRRQPGRMARSAHAVLREEWLAAVSQRGAWAAERRVRVGPAKGPTRRAGAIRGAGPRCALVA